MVDDFSTDSTREVMTVLSKKKDNVTLVFNEKNLGGGATRNIATRKASSDIIFCLDSDDMLGEGTLEIMYRFIKQKQCDGVGIQTSIKFKGVNINNIAFINQFGYVGEQIPFESLIEKNSDNMCSLYSTFMFTKKAFEMIGGYPENHGFDTQSFAWRFLANGLVAYACPGATYLHRIQFNKSYYIREYESGRINHNWYKTLEEFLYLFDEKIQKAILFSDLNDPTRHILDVLKKSDVVFRNDYQKFVINNTLVNYEEKLRGTDQITNEDRYWLGVRKMSKNDFFGAFDLFEELIKDNFSNGYVHYYLKICSEETGRKSGLINEEKINKLFSYSRQGSQLNIIIRILRKIIRIIKGKVQ